MQGWRRAAASLRCFHCAPGPTQTAAHTSTDPRRFSPKRRALTRISQSLSPCGLRHVHVRAPFFRHFRVQALKGGPHADAVRAFAPGSPPPAFCSPGNALHPASRKATRGPCGRTPGTKARRSLWKAVPVGPRPRRAANLTQADRAACGRCPRLCRSPSHATGSRTRSAAPSRAGRSTTRDRRSPTAPPCAPGGWRTGGIGVPSHRSIPRCGSYPRSAAGATSLIAPAPGPTAQDPGRKPEGAATPPRRPRSPVAPAAEARLVGVSWDR